MFSKFNSFASENGLAGTKLYLDCIIDEISIVDTGESIVIVAYLIDGGNNKWIAVLNDTSLVNEKEYNSVIGKPLVFCATYDGYSTKINMPFIYLDELFVKETGEIKSGFGKLLSITGQETVTEISPKENSIIYDFTTASGIEHYLSENYSSVSTDMGIFKFTHIVRTPYFRDSNYDYSISFEGDFYQISEISYLIGTRFTEEQQEATKQQLKDFMKLAANDIISKVGNKKIEGSYYISRYKYPNLKDIISVYDNLEIKQYCSWTNYDWNDVSITAAASSFRWRASLDEEKW